MMSFACPYCYSKINKKSKKGVRITCDNCNRLLPYGIEDSGDLTIAVVGPKGVGKSQYIPILIRTLQTTFAKEFGTSLVAATEKTNEKQASNIKSLFVKKEVIIETGSIEADSDYQPYIYYMRKTGFMNRIKCITLVFHDTAGEDLKDMENMPETIKNYLGKADCLIYLADPLQIDYVRSCTSLNNAELPFQETDITTVLGRITNVIRSYGGSSIKGKLKTNLAIVFTKSDVLFKDPRTEDEAKITFDESSYVRRRRAFGKVDIDNIDKAHYEIEEFVDRITGSYFTSTVANDYENYHYFMVSALGQNPLDHHSLIGQPIPFKVEDPLIWLLHITKSGMVGGK